MEILINLLILSITLFLYIHIYNQIKTSNYLEVYEIDNISKDKFEELCDLKQPLLIDNINILNFDINYIKNTYGSFDLKINAKDNNDMYLPMKFLTAIELFDKDISANYISQNNKDFLEETSLIKEFHINDMFLRPIGTSSIDYDIILGSINSYTPLSYSLNCRNYLSVLTGSIEITLCPPKDYKYLYVNKDYDNFKFTSSIDIQNPQDEYKDDFEKIKFLRVILEPNKLLQIPAYWFFSIKILESNTLISNFKYTTYMNSLAMAPDLFIKFLQNNNIKRNLAKVADL
tara:strand:+ start:5184 stop:6047 length:864 start_codon:yes stop_codon:yes gene_type:complete